MSRPWTGYIAGAAFALYAAAGAAAYAAPAATPAPAAKPEASQDRVERQERTVIIRNGDGDDHTMVFRGGDGAKRVMIHRNGADQAEHLRTMLQLKPSQEPALTAYLAAVQPKHDHERMVEMSSHGDAKTTPQRLADMETRLAEHTATMHARLEATRTFYNQLEPSQKKVFDELPMLMIGPMGPMMPMGPMKVMVNMPAMPPLPPAPPASPRAPPPPKS